MFAVMGSTADWGQTDPPVGYHQRFPFSSDLSSVTEGHPTGRENLWEGLARQTWPQRDVDPLLGALLHESTACDKITVGESSGSQVKLVESRSQERG